MRLWLPLILVCLATATGCGTTKWTNTPRTATEQLLITDAMDRAVARLDFRAVAGKKVFLDATPLAAVIDSAYLTSLLRQHMLAAGCIVIETREEADYVVEVRAGAVGTDHRELLLGVAATNTGGVIPLPGVPESIPKMPLATRDEQRAVVKLAAFAYNRKTGRPIWQSGTVPVESKVKDIWVLGAGPFRRGSIVDGTKFAGSDLKIPLGEPGKKGKRKQGLVSVADEAYFTEPKEHLAKEETPPAAEAPPAAAPVADGAVIQADHAAPAAPPAPEASEPAAPPPEPPAVPPTVPPADGAPAPLDPPPATEIPPPPPADEPTREKMLYDVPAPPYMLSDDSRKIEN